MNTPQNAHRLILGGARSGKTAHALRLAEEIGPRRIYLATAQAHDAEMAARIALHKAERIEGWRTVEEPVALPQTLSTCRDADVVLVDCLTLWLSNLILKELNVENHNSALLDALAEMNIPVILVSNEVGLSLVPETPLGRAFRDAQGLLNQKIAAALPHVDFVTAGILRHLKP